MNPNAYHACFDLAEMHHRRNNVKLARDYYCRAIQLNPGFFQAHVKLARLYHEQRQLTKAISCYQRAISLNPTFAEAYYYLGCAYHDQNALGTAIRCYQKAIDLNPNLFNAYNSMGTAWQGLEKNEKALLCFNAALSLNPVFDAAYVNRGNVFQEKRQYLQALNSYRAALKISPMNETAFLNMGTTLMRLNKAHKARACYQRAFKLNPRYAKACAYLVNRLCYECAWSTLDDLNQRLDHFTESALSNGKKPAETPFQNLSRHADPRLNKLVAAAWSRSITPPKGMPPVNYHHQGKETRMIRIGYLSNTFANHPGSHLISGIFRLHDRSQFQIFSFSYGVDDGSYYRKRIEKDSDHFFDISQLSDNQAAALIRQHRIDILIDLRGFTHGHRLRISALRPAPIHVVYLGYPGTTGADFIDYLIGDKVVVPQDHLQYFSEKIVYMPHCYQANDNTQQISGRTFQRSEFNIPDDAFAFCSFATHYKIEAVMFDCWTRILKQVPRSVLCLVEGGKGVQHNLQREIINRGVDEKRLFFVNKLPKDEHLARLKLMDLSLDTRIYNGHTTTSDALWAGIPVLTVKGGHFASRVSASILQAMGLPELITHEIGEYEALAVRIATDRALLRELKEKVAANRSTAPLFDTPRFTRNLERAYREMIAIHRRGDAPRLIEVRDRGPE